VVDGRSGAGDEARGVPTAHPASNPSDTTEHATAVLAHRPLPMECATGAGWHTTTVNRRSSLPWNAHCTEAPKATNTSFELPHQSPGIPVLGVRTCRLFGPGADLSDAYGAG